MLGTAAHHRMGISQLPLLRWRMAFETALLRLASLAPLLRTQRDAQKPLRSNALAPPRIAHAPLREAARCTRRCPPRGARAETSARVVLRFPFKGVPAIRGLGHDASALWRLRDPFEEPVTGSLARPPSLSQRQASPMRQEWLRPMARHRRRTT